MSTVSWVAAQRKKIVRTHIHINFLFLGNLKRQNSLNLLLLFYSWLFSFTLFSLLLVHYIQTDPETHNTIYPGSGFFFFLSIKFHVTGYGRNIKSYFHITINWIYWMHSLVSLNFLLLIYRYMDSFFSMFLCFVVVARYTWCTRKNTVVAHLPWITCARACTFSLYAMYLIRMAIERSIDWWGSVRCNCSRFIACFWHEPIYWCRCML